MSMATPGEYVRTPKGFLMLARTDEGLYYVCTDNRALTVAMKKENAERLFARFHAEAYGLWVSDGEPSYWEE